jgi:hypothetical protein
VIQRAAFPAIAALLLLSAIHAQTIQVDKTNRTIAITTTDSASALADTARISIGFQAFAPDADTAYRNGAERSNAVVEALKKAGVADKDIQSESQNLDRTQFPDNTPPTERTQRQFTLQQNWTVTTSAKEAARVLQAAIQAGANQSGNIDWELTTRDALQAQAAAKALVHARAIAAQMAAGLGVHLGPLLYASNQAPERRLFTMAEVAPSPMARGAAAPLAILPHKVEESATVYAIFSIE